MEEALREALERAERAEALADERLRQLRHAEERLRYVIGRPS